MPLDSTIVVTSNPENAKHILVDEFKNYQKGETFRRNFLPLLGSGIFNQDHTKIWERERKVSSKLFSRMELRNMIVVFNKHAKSVLDILDKHVLSGEPVDVQVLCCMLLMLGVVF